MYDRTYVTVKRLYVELNRLRYNHVDDKIIYEQTNTILKKLKELESILKQKIEE